MLTVWLPMCSTVAPMARGVGGDIPSNDLGQDFTSSSGLTHLLGAYGAPIGCRRGAADRPRSMRRTSPGNPKRVPCAAFCGGRTQHIPMSAPAAKNRVRNAFGGTENVLRMLFQPYLMDMYILLVQHAENANEQRGMMIPPTALFCLDL